MVKIRLKRMGSKFNAFYRIVVTDSRSPRDGRFIEELGFYDPHSKQLKIDKELSFKWLSNGAQLTDTAKNLFTKEKILEQYNKSKPKKVVKKSKPRKSTKSKEAKKTSKVKKETTKKTQSTKKEE